MPAPSSRGPITVDTASLMRTASIIKAQGAADLRLELLRGFRKSAAPLVSDLKTAIGTAPSGGHPHDGPGLRETIAGSIVTQTKLSSRDVSVRVRQKSTPNLRGFRFAGRRFNRGGFRHPVFGRGGWAEQTGAPGWFDNTTARHKSDITSAAREALRLVAFKIALASKGSK